jgi:hypothetical protein
MKITPTMKTTPMRSRAVVLILAMVIATWGGAAAAGDVYVICSAGVALKPDEVRNVFLGEQGFAGSIKLFPADNSAAQADFLEKVLKLDPNKYAGIWTKKSFRDGTNPPPVKGSDAEAIAYVKQTAGACTYVSSAPAGVAVVAKF